MPWFLPSAPFSRLYRVLPEEVLSDHRQGVENAAVRGEPWRVCMKVFVFDLLAYGENLEHVKDGAELPYPLSKGFFKADVAVRTYAEHLAAWEEMDKLG